MSEPSKKSSWRGWSARCIAVLAAVVAASWGPTGHSLRVAVSVSPDAVSSCRLVFASACENSKSKKSGAPKTERSNVRLFNAVPESLECAQPLHFDLDQAPPIAPLSLLEIWRSVQQPQVISGIRSNTIASANLSRGPPANA